MELLIHNLTTPHAKQLMENSVDRDCALAAAVWCAYTLPIYEQNMAQWKILINLQSHVVILEIRLLNYSNDFKKV